MLGAVVAEGFGPALQGVGEVEDLAEAKFLEKLIVTSLHLELFEILLVDDLEVPLRLETCFGQVEVRVNWTLFCWTHGVIPPGVCRVRATRGETGCALRAPVRHAGVQPEAA